MKQWNISYATHYTYHYKDVKRVSRHTCINPLASKHFDQQFVQGEYQRKHQSTGSLWGESTGNSNAESVSM